MLKRAFLVLLALLVLLAAAVAVNTLRHGSRQLEVAAAPALAIDEAGVASRLAAAVRFRTVSSRQDPDLNADEFRRFHAWLAQSFPNVHAKLTRENVGHLGLLYTWSGSDPQAAPIVLMAHQDVVPVAPGTEGDWQHAPFSGAIQDGFVWGRGAWDDKGNLITELEALELLVASGFEPRRTIYLASGADEEVGGLRGAAEIARLLQSRGVRPEFVLDEGMLITEGIMPGLSRPAALIGVAEKGYLSILLEAHATPGHSSMPDPNGGGAIALLSASLVRLQQQPMPAALSGVARETFETVAPEMSGFARVALSNLWLFGPLVQAQLERAPSTNAVLRTTTAFTIVQGGNQDNVIPGRAEATLNFRLLPGDTRESVLAHVRKTIGDERIKVSSLPGSSEPSPVTPTSSASYELLHRTVRSLFPQAVVVPGLMVAATDSRHFNAISEHVLRFSPVRATAEDLKRFHGTNERIATSNLAELVRFYVQLLRNAQAAPA